MPGPTTDLTGTNPVRRVMTSISADGRGFHTNNPDVLMRIPIALPVNTTRWRLRVSTANADNVATLTDVYVGPMTVSAGLPSLRFGSTPTKVFDGGDTPVDGSDWISPWVGDATLQFGSYAQTISIGYTTESGVSVAFSSNTAGWCSASDGSAAQVAELNPTNEFIGGAALLDIRLEYEYVGDDPVGLIIGDSTAIGVNGSLPFPTWAAIAGMKERFAWVNTSGGGVQYSDYTDTSYQRWTRFDWTVVKPDFAILNCGINDASNGISSADFITNLQTTIALATACGAERIIVATVIPQPQFKPGVLRLGYTSGASSMSTSIPFANGDVVDVGYAAANYEQLTVSGDSTGNGPYATSFSSNSAKAHLQGEPISLVKESTRQAYNAYIRGGAANVDQVIDFEAQVAGPDQGSGAVESYQGQPIHPLQAGYCRMAEAVRFCPR